MQARQIQTGEASEKREEALVGQVPSGFGELQREKMRPLQHTRHLQQHPHCTKKAF